MGSVDPGVRGEVLALEAGLQEALMNSDSEWFSNNWAPDAIYVHMSGGVDDRGSFIERLRSRATVYNDRQTGDIELRQYGPTVVATGWSTIDIVVGGVRKVLDTRFTRVYAMVDGRWMLASNQSGANIKRSE